MLRFIGALFLLGATVAHGQQPIPIIFDTDIGSDIDDALALALALQSPELDVRAVTTVSDDTIGRSRLAWKEMGLYDRHDIPLATGASETLVGPALTQRVPPQFQVLAAEDVLPPAARRRAADLIVDTLLDSPRKLTLVPVGPLTNIALALKMEPRIKEKIERIVLMGGAFGLLRPEYNIRRDYIASSIVFGSGVPITAVGLDVTLRCRLEGADMERLRAAGNDASRLLVRLIELWQAGQQPGQYPTLHDPLAMAVVFRAALVETQLGRVDVETTGAFGNGLTLFTPADRLPKNVTASTLIARQVNVRGFLDLLVGRLAVPPRAR
jgi:inosine-uridine nucleoside N-ribohydrolase